MGLADLAVERADGEALGRGRWRRRLGGQAVLDAAEFVLLSNMLRGVIKPLRRAVTVFRRVRGAVVGLIPSVRTV
jgi:hypothetical protein